MGDWVILFGKNLFSRLNVIKRHFKLLTVIDCYFLGVRKAINSMQDLFHSWAVCKLFFLLFF